MLPFKTEAAELGQTLVTRLVLAALHYLLMLAMEGYLATLQQDGQMRGGRRDGEKRPEIALISESNAL